MYTLVLSHTLRAALVAVALCMIAPTAAADLAPEEVLFIWNSTSEQNVSQQVRDAYIAAHPGVHDLDLNMTYLEDGSFDPQNPPPNAVTEAVISPEAFELFVRDPILNYIEQNNLDILCIVTSRGLPGLIVSNFAFNHFRHGQEDGVICSFESALTKLGLEGPTDVIPVVGIRGNPYYGALNMPFREFLDQSCALGPGGISGHGRLYLVSRLDASQVQGAPAADRALPIIDMINRAANLPPINQHAVTIVIDDNPGGCVDHRESREAAQTMRDNGWIVYYDDTKRFLHGNDQPASEAQCVCLPPDEPPLPNCQTVEPALEGVYNAYPEIVHASLGHIHNEVCGGDGTFECASPFVARHYFAHPAALWVTGESYSGLHIWRNVTPHADALDWPTYSSASFALVNSFAPPSHTTTSKADACMINFYEHGMSWGEAALSSLRRVGYMQSAIGDPLARVVVYRTDVNNDRRTDIDDLLIVQHNLGLAPLLSAPAKPAPLSESLQPRWRDFNPAADINQDGFVSAADLALVIEAFGRDADDPALNDIPADPYAPGAIDFCDIADEITDRAFYRCHGDVNGDFVVDITDQQIMQQHESCACPDFDLNSDGFVDQLDIDIASQFGTLEALADVDDDGMVTCTDLALINANICQNNCPPENLIYDLNCDGNVDNIDSFLVKQFVTCD